jgi:DnaJ-class molecular chaperone
VRETASYVRPHKWYNRDGSPDISWDGQSGRGRIMKTMTCYGCKGKGHVAGEVCHICGGLGKIPVPPEPFPPDPEIEEKPEKE